jgi:hypothetical protein
VYLHKELLRDFLCLKKSLWQMSPSERLIIIGLLELLRPASVLEIGHRFGGCTEWLSKYAQEVYTVDIDSSVLDSSLRFPNVTPFHLSSAQALQMFAEERRHFDMCIIDGDHSAEGAYSDLAAALKLANIILLHDTSNPTCRSGYIKALIDQDVYYELDLVDGHLQTDGLWGGIGIVVTMFSAEEHYQLTPKKSNYLLLSKAYYLNVVRVPLRRMVGFIRRRR